MSRSSASRFARPPGTNDRGLAIIQFTRSHRTAQGSPCCDDEAPVTAAARQIELMSAKDRMRGARRFSPAAVVEPAGALDVTLPASEVERLAGEAAGGSPAGIAEVVAVAYMEAEAPEEFAGALTAGLGCRRTAAS